MQTIIITRQPIELFKILKFEGLASSGGQAKSMIADGLVKVNGNLETRKRKQMNDGDQIEFEDQAFVIKFAPQVE